MRGNDLSRPRMSNVVFMNQGSAIDKAEQIKWDDALDSIVAQCQVSGPDFPKAARLLIECRHPDAQWLRSLFPVGGPVTTRTVLRAMEAQGDDPRALFIRCHLIDYNDYEQHEELMRRAAELGYPRAQVARGRRVMEPGSQRYDLAQRFAWTEKAAAQGDRLGLQSLGHLLWHGVGCMQDRRPQNWATRRRRTSTASARLGRATGGDTAGGAALPHRDTNSRSQPLRRLPRNN